MKLYEFSKKVKDAIDSTIMRIGLSTDSLEIHCKRSFFGMLSKPSSKQAAIHFLHNQYYASNQCRTKEKHLITAYRNWCADYGIQNPSRSLIIDLLNSHGVKLDNKEFIGIHLSNARAMININVCGKIISNIDPDTFRSYKAELILKRHGDNIKIECIFQRPNDDIENIKKVVPNNEKGIEICCGILMESMPMAILKYVDNIDGPPPKFYPFDRRKYLKHGLLTTPVFSAISARIHSVVSLKDRLVIEPESPDIKNAYFLVYLLLRSKKSVYIITNGRKWMSTITNRGRRIIYPFDKFTLYNFDKLLIKESIKGYLCEH